MIEKLHRAPTTRISCPLPILTIMFLHSSREIRSITRVKGVILLTFDNINIELAHAYHLKFIIPPLKPSYSLKNIEILILKIKGFFPVGDPKNILYDDLRHAFLAFFGRPCDMGHRDYVIKLK